MPGYEVDILMYSRYISRCLYFAKASLGHRSQKRGSDWRIDASSISVAVDQISLFGIRTGCLRGQDVALAVVELATASFLGCCFRSARCRAPKVAPRRRLPRGVGEKVTFLNVARQSLSSLPFLTKVLVSYAFAWVVFSYGEAENRLLILAPVNHAGEAFKDFADGLELRIMNSLKRLADLLSTPDRGVTPVEMAASKRLRGAKSMRSGST